MAVPALDLGTCLATTWQVSPALWVRVAVLAGLLAVLAWVAAKRFFPGRSAFLGMHVAMAGWLLLTAFEHASLSLDCKASLAIVAWPAILAIPPLWALFLRQYVNSEHDPAPLRQVLGFGLPLLLMSLLALSNGEHGLLYSGRQLSDPLAGGMPAVRYARGPVFVAAMVWGYGLLLGSSITVLRAWRRAEGFERSHWLGFLLISVIPWASNLMYVVFDWRLFGKDPTPVSFAFAAAGFAWLVRARRLFDVVPMARHLLFIELPDPVLILDNHGRVMEANTAARRLAGSGRAIGQALGSWPRFGAQLAERLIDAHSDRPLVLDAPGTIFDVRVHPIGGSSRQIGQLVQLRDVTEQQQAQTRMVQTLAERNTQLSQVAALQDELREQALRDPLTGLHNRRALEQRFSQEAEYHGTTGQAMSLVLIDVDHFKHINDSRGHAAGDAVLCELAALLRSGLRSGDTVFRVGGEEFALLLPGASATQAATRVATLHDALSAQPPAAAGEAVTFSAGVAAFGDTGTTLDAMLRAADTALYLAKAQGRNRTVLARTDG